LQSGVMKRAHQSNEDDVSLAGKLMTNAFRLQCEDAERDRQPDPKAVSKWEEVVRKVASTLKNAKLKHSCEYKDLDYWSKRGVSHPLAEHAAAMEKTTSSVPKYEWTAPREIIILSESAVNLLCANCFTVNVFVTLPDNLFGKRDYINLIYPTKRAHYMCSAIIALRKAFNDFTVDFVPGFAEDKLFPNVQVTDNTGSGKVLIHFGAAESTLAKASRFAPNFSNLRASTIYASVTDKDEEPTPFYNQRILRTVLESAMIRRVSAELRHKETVTAALALVNRWFTCRGFHEFDPVFLACFMAKLMEDNVVVKQQDLLTVLRNFIVAIVNWDTSTPAGFHPDDLEDDVITAHLATFPVVFLDQTGYWNISSGISKESLVL
ncbi:hypothetical protein TELCIR_20463, partial [Teladorsagia circumcincta]